MYSTDSSFICSNFEYSSAAFATQETIINSAVAMPMMMNVIITLIIIPCLTRMVFGFLLCLLYARRKLLQILQVTDFHHPIIERQIQTAMRLI